MQNVLAISRFSGPLWDLEARPWEGIPNCESHGQTVRVGRSDFYNPLLWSRGGALANFAWHGVGHLATLGPPSSFWIVCTSLSKHNRRWRILLETQQIRRICQGWEKLLEVFKVCFLDSISSFLHCLSSQKSWSGAIDVNLRIFFGYGMKFLLI